VGKITCSELPYHVYPGVHWQTDAQFGQHTISPDQVAAVVLDDNAPFELIELYTDGRIVDPSEARERLRRLLDEST
jgi:hypothetical protein